MKPEELIKNNALTDISVSGGQMVVPIEIALTAINMTRLEVPEMAQRVISERKRQIEIEGYTPLQDDFWTSGQLAMAASCYATPYIYRYLSSYWDSLHHIERCHLWPEDFFPEMYKPEKNNSSEARIRVLEKSGALILAEMERLQRILSRKD